MAIPHIAAGDKLCQTVKMYMVIMTSVNVYDITQAELFFFDNCGVI